MSEFDKPKHPTPDRVRRKSNSGLRLALVAALGLSGAAEVDVDGVGRILVPEHQKEYAGLKREVIFAGISDRVEIWDSSRWQSYKARIEKDAEQMAAKLGEIGVL